MIIVVLSFMASLIAQVREIKQKAKEERDTIERNHRSLISDIEAKQKEERAASYEKERTQLSKIIIPEDLLVFVVKYVRTDRWDSAKEYSRYLTSSTEAYQVKTRKEAINHRIHGTLQFHSVDFVPFKELHQYAEFIDDGDFH